MLYSWTKKIMFAHSLAWFHFTSTPDQFPSWSFKGVVTRKASKSGAFYTSFVLLSPSLQIVFSMKIKHELAFIPSQILSLSLALLWTRWLWQSHAESDIIFLITLFKDSNSSDQIIVTFPLQILLSSQILSRAACSCSSLVLTLETNLKLFRF